jgi:hypothetical protein
VTKIDFVSEYSIFLLGHKSVKYRRNIEVDKKISV